MRQGALVAAFGRRLRMMHLARLKRSRKVEDIIQRLWRETVSSDYMKAGGTWTLEHYMDYHLSLFVYFETRYGGEEGEITEMEARAAMVDAAWESALEDYYGDIKAAKVEAAKTGGDPKLDFNTFSASVFELTSLYADSRSEEDFCEFLRNSSKRRPYLPSGLVDQAPVLLRSPSPPSPLS
jgi:hypothetical protein